MLEKQQPRLGKWSGVWREIMYFATVSRCPIWMHGRNSQEGHEPTGAKRAIRKKKKKRKKKRPRRRDENVACDSDNSTNVLKARCGSIFDEGWTRRSNKYPVGRTSKPAWQK